MQQEEDDRSFGESVADAVAAFGGSWKFIISFSVVLILWITLNALALFDFIAWDKPPFILLNLLLSFVAAFQAPFIMMSQNRAEKKQDAAYRNLFKEIRELIHEDIEYDSCTNASVKEMLKKLEMLERRQDQDTRETLAIVKEIKEMIK